MNARLLTASIVLSFPLVAWGSGCGGGNDTETSGTTTATTTGTSTTTSTTTSSTGGGQGGDGGEGGQGGQGGAGGGTGGVGGVSGGGRTPGSDLCPVQVINMNLNETATLNGTTAAATDDYSSFCGDTTPAADNNDVVYGFNIPEGVVTFDLQAAPGSTLNPAMYLEPECGVADPAASYCFDGFTDHEYFKDYFFAGTIYVVVDGVGGTAGDFTLKVTTADSACGDGVLGPEEQCDPVPPGPNDGCIDPGAMNQCKFEPPPANKDVCNGEPVAVPQGVTTLLATDGHTNIGYTDDYIGSCNGDVGGADRVYQLTPAVTGTLTVKIGYEVDGVTPTCDATQLPPTCWDQAIYLRASCTDTLTELDCSDINFATPEEVTAPVVAGVPIFLIVDGYDSSVYSMGTYNLRLELN